MSTTCITRKDSLKLFSEREITNNDKVPAVVIQDLKNPAWVASAVNQLKDIDFHLQNKEIDQHKKISDNINNIISCLQTLDKCRLQLHEELEKEAITTFGLHHTIKNLPSSIQLEITAAVKAAHAQNEMDIEDKTAILSELEDKICTLREEQLKLEKDNNSLLPQRNLIRKQHDGLVINLNKLLEEKSRILITMNETREKILQCNQEIVETEIKIQKLKAALNEEHDKANKKIEDYKRDIEKVTKKKKLWEKKNIRVSEELNMVNADLTEQKMALQELQNDEKLQEKAVLELKKQNQNLKLQIDGEKSAQANLTNTKKKLTETLAKITKKYENSFDEKKKIADDLKLRVDYETKRNKELQENEEQQQKSIDECTDAETKAKKEVKDVEARLQSCQHEFSEYTENLASLDIENTQNKDAIQKMSENHSLTIAQFNREIEKRKTALKEEKQLRLDTEKERDSLTKQLRVTEEHQMKYSSQMNQKISKLKGEFAERSTEGRELQKEVQEKNQALQKLDEETKAMKEKLKNLADDKEELVKQTKNTIESLEETIKDRTKILEDKTPLFEEIERQYQERCKLYQERKEAFSIQRRNETNLKKDLHQTQKNMEEMKVMQEKNQKKIKTSQDSYLSILNSNSEESKLLEEEIYVQSCKLKSVIEENHTLKKSKEELEREIGDTEECIKDGETLQQKIIKELGETRDKLTNTFKERIIMEETLNCRDTEMMQQMSGVLNILNYNSQQVNSVAEQLFKELEGLGIYLDKVRHKRAH